MNTKSTSADLVAKALTDQTGTFLDTIPAMNERLEKTTLEVQASVAEHGINLSLKEARALAVEIEAHHQVLLDRLRDHREAERKHATGLNCMSALVAILKD